MCNPTLFADTDYCIKNNKSLFGRERTVYASNRCPRGNVTLPLAGAGTCTTRCEHAMQSYIRRRRSRSYASFSVALVRSLRFGCERGAARAHSASAASCAVGGAIDECDQLQ